MNSERVIPTCKKEKCELWQMYGTNCPNYAINMFSTHQGQVYPVEDCDKIRMTNMIMEMRNEITELKKMFVEMRNAYFKAEAGAQSLVNGLHNSEVKHIMLSKEDSRAVFLGEERPQLT